MIFLLTNDDGIDSPKLQITKEILEKFGTVYTVAPSSEQSAKSMSLTIGGFNFKKIDNFNYSIEGTPVDCVNFAYAGLSLEPDYVVSGTNHGYNIGIDTKYSGTVGAALQGQYYGFKSIALSADRSGNKILNNELEKTMKHIIKKNLGSTEYTLNINFPREKFGKSKGIVETVLHFQVYGYEPKIDGDKFKPYRLYINEAKIPKGTDTYAYAKGYTSISKINL